VSSIVRKRPTLGAAALAVCAALAGCGGSGGSSDADPAKIVPGTAPLYAEVVVRPEGDQRDQLEAVLRKVMRTGDPGAKIRSAFDRATREDGVTWERDIKPWLGERAGVFLTGFDRGGEAAAAVVMTATDTDKAMAALRKGERAPRKKTYKDVSYEVYSGGNSAGIVEGFAVAGTEQGLRQAIDASKDEERSLSENDDYDKSREEVGDEGLSTIYADPGGLLNALSSSGAVDRNAVTALRQILMSSGGEAVGASVRAEEDRFEVESATLGVKKSSVPAGNASGALTRLPGDAWLAAGIGNIGGRLDQSLRQAGQLGAIAGFDLESVLGQVRRQSGIDVRRDLLSWMGDGGFFVRGTSLGDAGGALVVQSKNPERSRAVVAKIGRFLRSQGAPVRALRDAPGVDAGISVRFGNFEAALAAAGDRFVIAVGASALEAALSPSEKLGDSAGFKSAAEQLGGDAKPTFFFDMQPLLQLVEGLGVGDDPDYRKAQPYLRAFSTIAAGAKRDGDIQRGKLVVGVR